MSRLIKQGLLAVPFVLHSQPTAVFEPGKGSTEQMAAVAQRRYLEIIRDVEELINDHSTPSTRARRNLTPVQSATSRPARRTCPS
jgi:hypothetical protein